MKEFVSHVATDVQNVPVKSLPVPNVVQHKEQNYQTVHAQMDFMMTEAILNVNHVTYAALLVLIKWIVLHVNHI